MELCANQLHKHNMTELQRMKLIQKEHDARQKTQGGTGANQYTKEQSAQSEHTAKDGNRTATKIAEEVGRGIDKAKRLFFVFSR